jgi:hypothetical protein
MEFDSDPVPDDTPMTLAELGESLRRVLGVDLPFEPPRGPGPHALRRINAVNTRLADRYREGNDATALCRAVPAPEADVGLVSLVMVGAAALTIYWRKRNTQ